MGGVSQKNKAAINELSAKIEEKLHAVTQEAITELAQIVQEELRFKALEFIGEFYDEYEPKWGVQIRYGMLEKTIEQMNNKLVKTGSKYSKLAGITFNENNMHHPKIPHETKNGEVTEKNIMDWSFGFYEVETGVDGIDTYADAWHGHPNQTKKFESLGQKMNSYLEELVQTELPILYEKVMTRKMIQYGFYKK